MAQRRMFSKTITNSSQFLMMPPTAQNLYFHLGMNADDDGYCEHFGIARMTDSKPDDLRILHARGFVHVFDDKVLVILAWKENNYLRADRYTASKYLKLYEKEMADLVRETSGIPVVDQTVTQVRLGKDSIEQHSTEQPKKTSSHPDYVATVALFYPPGCEYKPDAKQCRHIKDLLKVYTLANIRTTLERLQDLKNSNDPWWRQQPAVPSNVRQHWERINESRKAYKTVEELYG